MCVPIFLQKFSVGREFSLTNAKYYTTIFFKLASTLAFCFIYSVVSFRPYLDKLGFINSNDPYDAHHNLYIFQSSYVRAFLYLPHGDVYGHVQSYVYAYSHHEYVL